MSANWKPKTIWTGDCLDILRGMNSESIDLIYLDPPFNSKTNYAAPIGSRAAGAAFKDTWSLSDVDSEWINLIEAKHPALHRVLLAAMTSSDKSYLAYMAARLLEMRRILKPTGSIYLHCDPTMSHYLKVVMDAIFDHRNFCNEIIWCYGSGGASRRHFSKKHDTILFYGKEKQCYTFNVDSVREPYSSPHKSMTPKIVGNKLYTKMDPRGRIPFDWWRIPILTNSSKERVGYPTQKPLALLDRIIRASSNPGDAVLDPFCGCATTLVAAETLGRAWAGIDISPKAAELVVERVEDHQGLWRDIVHRTDIPARTDLGDLPNYRTHRVRLYGIQGGNCAGCDAHFEARHLEVDHIISKRKGGTDHIENLQLLCGSCNRIKGDRGMEYLRAKLQLK